MRKAIGFLALLIVISAFFTLSTPLFANTAPLDNAGAPSLNTAVTLTAAADAYVDSANPSTNYGTSTQIRIDGSPVINSYVRFNVSGVSGTVSNATLRIYANSSLGVGYAVHGVSNNTWSESTINYSNAPAMGSVIGTSTVPVAASWTSVNVTSLVTGNGTFTFGITDPSATALSLASRESAYAPQLVLTTSSTATATPTTSGGGTGGTLKPVADAYTSAAYPSTNYGTSTSLRDDGSPITNSYLRFSVSGLTSAVSKATLRIYANSALASGLVLHAVSDNTWGETTINYGNEPAMGSTLGTYGAITAGTWISLDVTPYVPGNGTFSFGLTDSNATAISMASRESTYSPQLVISTGSGTLPTSTPVPASTNTPVPTATKTPAPTSTPSGISSLPNFSHIYTILMENKEYSSIVGSSSAPYINSLIAQYGLATNYNANFHPSEPNYIALFAGSNLGVTTDGTYNLSGKNVADQIEASGRTWKMFAENVPLNCYTGSTASGGEDGSGNYVRRHEPAISFTDISSNSTRCNSHITDFTQFDPAAANYEFITPNLCNDMHDCSVSTGDTFLKGFVPKILNSTAWQNGGVLFLTWDEGSTNTGGGGRVATIVIAKNVPAGFKSSTAYNEYSYLKTIQDAWGLGCLNNTCSANNMAEFFR